MKNQFKILNKKIPTPVGIGILILFIFLISGGILGCYWQAAKKRVSPPSEIFQPKEEEKTGEGELFIIQSNPSPGKDGATDMAIDSEYVYIAGYEAMDEEGSRWRIEKRNKVTGKLVPEFGEMGAVGNAEGYDVIPYSITIDENSLYIVGEGKYVFSEEDTDMHEWRIEKRDKVTGELASEFGEEGVAISSGLGPPMHGIFPMSVVVDSDFLYIGGNEFFDWDMMSWRVEKRDKITGELKFANAINLPPYSAYERIHSMVIDADFLYAVGYEYSGYAPKWAVAKINKKTGSLMDEFGWEGVIIISEKAMSFSITADESYLYVGGAEALSTEEIGGDTQWRVEKRDKITGALITEFGKKGIVNVNPCPKKSSLGELVHSLIVDSDYLYIAGDDFSVDEDQWRIEKRDKTTGGLVSGFGEKGVITTNPSSGEDLPVFIKIDSNYIYIGGRDNIPGNAQWRIEKRDKSTGDLVRFKINE